ncbi:MAG: site-specific tyrosine recombinase XerD [Candidatus Planktophila sp.]|nr:site-specific tyrosine recombinase XerD [Candidatus Planktophila sp.]
MSTLSFDSLAQSFLNYCAIERGLSANTVAAYRRDLEKFSAFVSDISVADIDSTVIADFEASLRELHLSTPSLNRIQSTLRMFFKHVLIENGLANPTLEIVSGKSNRRLPKALQIDQIIALIEAAFHDGEPITLRDRALIELLYSSGARVSELIGINIADITIVENDDGRITTIKLRGKGAKERIVPLGSFATKAIDDYVVRIRPSLAAKNAAPNAALFLNARGGRLTRQSAWNIVLKAAQLAGISEKVSPHVFRHSYATHLLDGGADIRVVQELLGHASVTTTQIYTLITIDKVRESYATAHPRA